MPSNASFPLNDTFLNSTYIWALADSVEGRFELPYESWGIVVFVALAAVSAMLCVGCCYKPSEPMGLSFALSLLLLSVPVGNTFLVPASVDEDRKFIDGTIAVVIGVVQVVLLCIAVYLAVKMLAAAMTAKRLTIRTRECPEMEGQEYPHAYVGCNTCGQVLSLDYFFSCQTCTKGKVGCETAYELCQKCVFEHAKDHDVLYWENRRCHGFVDFEATKFANMEEAQALLGGADILH